MMGVDVCDESACAWSCYKVMYVFTFSVTLHYIMCLKLHFITYSLGSNV